MGENNDFGYSHALIGTLETTSNKQMAENNTTSTTTATNQT
jgi:hypothetical protein